MRDEGARSRLSYTPPCGSIFVPNKHPLSAILIRAVVPKSARPCAVASIDYQDHIRSTKHAVGGVRHHHGGPGRRSPVVILAARNALLGDSGGQSAPWRSYRVSSAFHPTRSWALGPSSTCGRWVGHDAHHSGVLASSTKRTTELPVLTLERQVCAHTLDTVKQRRFLLDQARRRIADESRRQVGRRHNRRDVQPQPRLTEALVTDSCGPEAVAVP